MLVFKRVGTQNLTTKLVKYINGQNKLAIYFTLPTFNKSILIILLICNMLPANNDGSKVLACTKPERKLQLYNTNGESQVYNLSACIVSTVLVHVPQNRYSISLWHCNSGTEDRFSSIVQHYNKWFWVDKNGMNTYTCCFTLNWVC